MGVNTFVYKNTASIFLNFVDFETRISLKYQRWNYALKSKVFIPIVVDALLQHKTKLKLMFCISNAKYI